MYNEGMSLKKGCKRHPKLDHAGLGCKICLRRVNAIGEYLRKERLVQFRTIEFLS